MDKILQAIEELKNGGKILLYDADDREGETDFVQTACSVKPDDVAKFRKEAGGLICVAIHSLAAEKLKLPFLSEILKAAANSGFGNLHSVADLRLPYDTRSAFSLWVNHRSTFTGITDIDRALTICEIGKAVKKVLEGEKIDFGYYFRSPGHVSILRAADRLTEERKGQTELSVALAILGDITPAMMICEMLDEKSGKAVLKKDAINYASNRDLIFLEGKEVARAYSKNPKSKIQNEISETKNSKSRNYNQRFFKEI